MKKFINSVDTILAESLDGFVAAHADIVALGPERKFVFRRSPAAEKVALISGGGSGHDPLHVGFVGTGMLDAACPGQIFTSPTPDQMVEAATSVGGKAGVLFIVKNYAGDCMNFEMAAELAEGRAATVITNDDVAVESSTHSAGRRGVRLGVRRGACRLGTRRGPEERRESHQGRDGHRSRGALQRLGELRRG